MHQLTVIGLCTLVFVFGVFGENDEDLPSAPTEVVSSGDNFTDGHVNNSADMTFNTSENPFLGSNDDPELAWLADALRDVAYYLRSYKFNEYDRRYHTGETPLSGQYFASYPRPPLRSLHWEVHKHCAPSFLQCIEFLITRIKKTDLRREDDTSVVIAQQKWFGSQYTDQITTVEEECKKMRERDNKFANPFQGPIERFQWRTTASYYLCWYAMNGVPDLEKLGEPCDNFANCLDPEFGAGNKDPRASENEPFHCILYSFCPDPCCPVRHISSYTECWESEVNPCFQENAADHRQCTVERARNTDFNDIVLNRWNVTCDCPHPGYVWESRYGTCVDVNECATAKHTCDATREVCVNLPGSYRCVCSWGHTWSAGERRCTPSAALAAIKRERLQKSAAGEPGKARSLLQIIKGVFAKLAAGDI